MKLSVILPSYKEAENLRILLPEVSEALKNIDDECEILVVDTMEPKDDTRDVTLATGAKYISRRGGDLYGDAVRTGIDAAQGKYLLFMDADGSHHPGDIARLYENAEKRDMDVVIGSRYIRGGNTDNPLLLIWMSSVLNFVYRIVFKLKVKDISNSFRIYRSCFVKSIVLKCNNFDIVEEILIRLNLKYPDIYIDEIPIRFRKRKFGESKRDLIEFVFSYINTMIKLKRITNEEISQ